MAEAWEFPTETISEGKVKAVVPNLKAYGVVPSDYAPSRAPVFYNPVMEFNRDVSVLALQVYQRIVNREISVCEPLTATGIRSLRYAGEVKGVKKVVGGDINEHAAKLAEQNVALNGLQDKFSVRGKDANRFLIEHSAPKTRFDAVDIDPFGTPVPHLDAAVQALRNHGLLAATATDMAPLCGVHAKACVRKYGGKPLRTEYCHELAVRFLAGQIASIAAAHDIGVRFLFSHCSEHYVRVYAQISYGCQRADEALRNLGYVLHCFGCLHREMVSKPFRESGLRCPECSEKMEYGGPLWTGKIFDVQFIEAMIEENARRAFRNSLRITKLLSAAKEESDLPPTYYVLDKMSGKLGLPAPSTSVVLQALLNAGFKASPTHFSSRGVRTDAPSVAVQNVLRELAKSAST